MVENNTENLEPKEELAQEAEVAVAENQQEVTSENEEFDWDALESEDQGFAGKKTKQT